MSYVMSLHTECVWLLRPLCKVDFCCEYTDIKCGLDKTPECQKNSDILIKKIYIYIFFEKKMFLFFFLEKKSFYFFDFLIYFF